MKLIAINRTVKRCLKELICSSCSACRSFCMGDSKPGHIKIVVQFLHIHLTDIFCTESRMEGNHDIWCQHAANLTRLLCSYCVSLCKYFNIHCQDLHFVLGWQSGFYLCKLDSAVSLIYFFSAHFWEAYSTFYFQRRWVPIGKSSFLKQTNQTDSRSLIFCIYLIVRVTL